VNAAQSVLPGMPVPIAECDWVLWRRCGCPLGVAVASYCPTEAEAWEAFYDSGRDVARAFLAGEHLELMPHSRYSTDVLPLMTVRCQHEEAS
jgi:hypothetical protein